MDVSLIGTYGFQVGSIINGIELMSIRIWSYPYSALDKPLAVQKVESSRISIQ